MIHIDRLLSALQLTDWDPSAFELMEAQLAWVSTRTGRYFGEVKQHTEYHTGGCGSIWLNEEPVVTDLQPLVASEWASASAYTTIASSSYALYGRELVYFDAPWPAWSVGMPRKNIRVTYYAGYEIGALPYDIEQLVLRRTARLWLDRGYENVRSEKIGDSYSYTRGAASANLSVEDAEDEKIISLWRTPVFA